jgi:hypothetical protein
MTRGLLTTAPRICGGGDEEKPRAIPGVFVCAPVESRKRCALLRHAVALHFFPAQALQHIRHRPNFARRVAARAEFFDDVAPVVLRQDRQHDVRVWQVQRLRQGAQPLEKKLVWREGDQPDRKRGFAADRQGVKAATGGAFLDVRVQDVLPWKCLVRSLAVYPVIQRYSSKVLSRRMK